MFRKAGTWEKLSPSGSLPPGRLYSEAMWSKAMDGFYIFAGYGTDNLNDIWFYSRQANSWTELSPSGTLPSVRSGPVGVWSDSADGFYMFSGWPGPEPKAIKIAVRKPERRLVLQPPGGWKPQMQHRKKKTRPTAGRISAQAAPCHEGGITRLPSGATSWMASSSMAVGTARLTFGSTVARPGFWTFDSTSLK